MPKIEGLTKLISQMARIIAKADKEMQSSVVVGYTSEYAVWVHENLEAYHAQGQAKFLEQPAREMGDALHAIIYESMRQGKTLSKALLRAGLALQAASQRLCPVDTGALRASAFTRLDTRHNALS